MASVSATRPRADAPARARHRVPRALLAVLLLVGICGVAWALASPAFQTPDEDVHFAYVESLAELGQRPGKPGSGAPVSAAQIHAINGTNVPPTTFFLYGRPEWTQTAYERWRREQAGKSFDDGGGSTGAETYPPAFYAFDAAFYSLGKGQDELTRLYAARLGGVVLLLLSTVAVWLLAGELFARRRIPQLIAAASVGLWPAVDFISASVNPDAMLITTWSLLFWWAAVIAHRGLTPARGLVLGAILAVAFLTKTASVVLPPCVLALVLWLAWRNRRSRPAVLGAVATLACFAIPVVLWGLHARGGNGGAFGQATSVASAQAFNVREFVSYLWQFYLPRLPFMTPIAHHYPGASSLPVLNTWVGMNWGVYGWVNVWWPRAVYTPALVLSGAFGLAGLALGARDLLTRRRRALPPGRVTLLVFLAACALALIAGVHWSDYKFYAEKLGGFAQGRYVLPVAGLAGLLVAYVLDALPARARRPAAGAWLGLLVVLQLGSLALVAERFYA